MIKDKQKAALKDMLILLCGSEIEMEKSFGWMCADINSIELLGRVYNSLVKYRGKENFFKFGYKPQCDFVCEKRKMIIEYDEKQHFSLPRKISLETYKDEISLGFDANRWIENCEKIKAKDNDPHYRDEQRAFYDSVRDLAANQNGYRLVRIKFNEFDLTSEKAHEYLIGVIYG